ncbi:MAG: SET domain-containing protein [Elusimicrobia bacterium]|nr:SET domain-containing protein [Elusimicrobiota bacterium]
MALRPLIGPSSDGRGVFAERPYAPGEVILVFTGEELSTPEVLSRGLRRHCLDIGSGRQLHVDPPARFVNHSCDPNAGLRDAVTLTALRPIPAGAEIRFDYSTCVPDESWSLECRCRSPLCRGLVVGFPRLDAKTKRRLLGLKIVPAWLLR